MEQDKQVRTIELETIVEGTALGDSGIPLFNALDDALSSGSQILLSMKNISSLSSSFLNASLGSIIDKYGISDVRKNISFTNCKKGVAITIKNYVARYIS